MSTNDTSPFLTLESRDSTRDQEAARALEELGIPGPKSSKIQPGELRLVYLADALELWDHTCVRRGVRISFNDIDVRTGSGNLSKKQPLARAVGRESTHIVDATAGFGHDSFLLACMGHTVTACERSPIIHLLLKDAYDRAMDTPHLATALGGRLRVVKTDSVVSLQEHHQDGGVIYLDPMFDPNNHGSALPKRPAQILRTIVGLDEDAPILFEQATDIAQRVVVKRARGNAPLTREPTHAIHGKTIRYDVYLQSK